MQLPAVGCVFRKRWADQNGRQMSATVSALNLVVPAKSRNLETALRITERIEDAYPHEIREKQRTGFYRSIDIDLAKAGDNRDDDGARLLLEQHCLWDFDEDGVEEPLDLGGLGETGSPGELLEGVAEPLPVVGDEVSHRSL